MICGFCGFGKFYLVVIWVYWVNVVYFWVDEIVEEKLNGFIDFVVFVFDGSLEFDYESGVSYIDENVLFYFFNIVVESKILVLFMLWYFFVDWNVLLFDFVLRLKMVLIMFFSEFDEEILGWVLNKLFIDI